jgi:hypothetical protein
MLLHFNGMGQGVFACLSKKKMITDSSGSTIGSGKDNLRTTTTP